VLTLPWDWSSTNLGEILHIGCSSIAAWIYIFGGAGPGFEPGTAFQQSGVLTSRPRLTPSHASPLTPSNIASSSQYAEFFLISTHFGSIFFYRFLPKMSSSLQLPIFFSLFCLIIPKMYNSDVCYVPAVLCSPVVRSSKLLCTCINNAER
jgi:hypothetical protein